MPTKERQTFQTPSTFHSIRIPSDSGSIIDPKLKSQDFHSTIRDRLSTGCACQAASKPLNRKCYFQLRFCLVRLVSPHFSLTSLRCYSKPKSPDLILIRSYNSKAGRYLQFSPGRPKSWPDWPLANTGPYRGTVPLHHRSTDFYYSSTVG